jgi:acyl transferase domain-containing protein
MRHGLYTSFDSSRVSSNVADARHHVLAFAAHDPERLDEDRRRLLAHLRANADAPIGPTAWTLLSQAGSGAHRCAVVARDAADAATVIEDEDVRRMITSVSAKDPPVVFMFPGGGSQYPQMGRDLYETEETFRREIDRGIERCAERTGIDLRPLLFPDPDQLANATRELNRSAVQLPAIFVVSMALNELLASRGVRPDALIGHSVGENVAACAAGVLSYEDALGLVALRGRLLENAPGTMTSVPLGSEKLASLLDELQLDLAAVNSPSVSVVSGNVAPIEELERRLAADGVEAQRVHIQAAPHSRMLESLLAEFGAYLRSIELHAPRIPLVSNLTGTWIGPEACRDPDYWVEQFRRTVRFADGLRVLFEDPSRFFLEVGPGRVLTSLVREAPQRHLGDASTLRHPKERISDSVYFLVQLARLWTCGARVDLASLVAEDRITVPSPPAM